MCSGGSIPAGKAADGPVEEKLLCPGLDLVGRGETPFLLPVPSSVSVCVW